MTKDEVELFEKLELQLKSLHTEIGLLSKKSQNDPLNKFKLKFVNKILADSNEFLTEENRPFEEFTVFNIDELPTNSDVTMILDQYLSSFEKVRISNIIRSRNFAWYWKIDGAESGKLTNPPKTLNK